MTRDDLKLFWQPARRYWFDGLIVAGIAIGIAGAVIRVHTEDGPRGPLWFDVLASVAILLPLLARRRFPVGALFATGFGVGASSFVDDRLVTDNIVWFFVGLALCVLFGMLPARPWSVAGLAFTVGVAAAVTHNDPTGGIGDFGWNAVVFAIAWTVGFAVGGKYREAGEAKERADRAEREREEQARLAVSEERARIARELHDVVGHSVSVMTVQASAVRRLLDPDQEKVNQALLVVEETGREALAEMRRMVGVLRRPEEEPAAL